MSNLIYTTTAPPSATTSERGDRAGVQAEGAVAVVN